MFLGKNIVEYCPLFGFCNLQFFVCSLKCTIALKCTIVASYIF